MGGSYYYGKLPQKSSALSCFGLEDTIRSLLWKTCENGHLRVWGSKCVVHIDKDKAPKRSKLDDKGRYGMFVGYSMEKKGYRVLVGKLEDGKIVTSHNGRFYEKDYSDDVSFY